MAYTYDEEMLSTHARTVEGLIQLGRTGSKAAVWAKDAREARRTQNHINNLLAVLVMFRPEHKLIRETVRTWIRYVDEKWVCYVGVPDEPLPGGRPKSDRAPVYLGNTKRGPDVIMGNAMFSELVADMDTWIKFGQWLAGLPETVQQAKVEFQQEIGSVEGLDVFEGWTPEVLSPTTARYRRNNGTA